MRGATEVTLPHHHILRLPCKMTLMIDPGHIWNVIYYARSNRCHPPTSPNTAPATQDDSPGFCGVSPGRLRRHLQRGTDPRMIRPWSDHETVSPQPASQPRLLFALTTSNFYWKIQHFALRLSLEISPNCCTCHEKWHLNFTKYCACQAKWLSRLIRVTYETLFTIRRATEATLQHQQILRLPRKISLMIEWSASHMKRYLQCAEQQVSSSDITEYCACHEKWLSWVIIVTYETLFTMRGATGVILQHHRTLRLPRKMTL